MHVAPAASVTLVLSGHPSPRQDLKAKLIFHAVHGATAGEDMKGFKTAFPNLLGVICLSVGQIKAFCGQIT